MAQVKLPKGYKPKKNEEYMKEEYPYIYIGSLIETNQNYNIYTQITAAARVYP